MRSARILAVRFGACLALGMPFAAAEDQPPAEAPATKAPSATSFLDEQEAWNFAPPVGRPDVFCDEVQRLTVAKQYKKIAEDNTGGDSHPQTHADDPVEEAKATITHIEGYMSSRKWEEAIKVADPAIKKLGAITGNPDLVKYVGIIKGYRDQADEALVRDQAQAAFDALNLKVEGIMWSENGSRLAIIKDEPKALGVNDRVKGCVIINIDTDRVDFRFPFNRKRFEFPRYVGEDAKSK